ncbi:hypothetical protein HHI36_012451 [Cryptolaemus montrouzieri]|uniref:SCP domain-containing protein n=1 Tax=Cryptolaemus montrouzieri TaxID=559131 RepID=A0ABD2NEA4_9CUCU
MSVLHHSEVIRQHEMQPNFIISIVNLYAIVFVLPAKAELVKPSFIPYCLKNDSCWSDCNCSLVPGCKVLPMKDHTRKYILDTMNQLRDAHSIPQPSGLPMLKYNRELEQLSKCWATKCQDKYSNCFITQYFSETSQSLGQIELENRFQLVDLHWSYVISTWYEEVSAIDSLVVKSLPEGEAGRKIHNFAQLMSDHVLYTGCAWSISNNTSIFVCTYGPRGPNKGESIYEIGEVCSKCPSTYKCNLEKPFAKLCKQLPNMIQEEEQVKDTTENLREGDDEQEVSTKPKDKIDKKMNILLYIGAGFVLIVCCIIVFGAMFYVLKMNVT